MNKLSPIPKLNISKIELNASVDVHASRLASFKSSVWRFNKESGNKYAFEYGPFKNDYCTVKRTS